ncbi:phosphotransferase [Streptomyces sp. NPDC057682]|uniref:phosphotransferase n=1 Tax=Streptomyces sp. NPDC057682 TaxID=3346210 RepID=UPI0036C0F358
MTADVVRALGALAHEAVHTTATGEPREAPGTACGCPAPVVLADRADGTVVRLGAVVAKAHAPGTDTAALAARLGPAADPGLAGILLPPLPVPSAAGGAGAPYLTALHGRPVTLWPYGAPVDPDDPDRAPWEEAGALLARLHRVGPRPAATPPPVPGPRDGGADRTGSAAPPPMRGPAKAALAVARMRAARPDGPATAPVLAAWAALPAWARDEEPAPAHRIRPLCHGDFHLGQLVRRSAWGGWLLIDIDDLGPGDPAWDLARPAAWFAAGLLPPGIWDRFLAAYRAGGGPAVRADGDPWPELDAAARALTVQTAALALAKCAAERRNPDEVEQVMIDSCARIAALPPELAAAEPS